MRYIHSLYDPALPDNLIFFGEDYSKPSVKKRGRKPKTIQESSHPYGLTYPDILSLVSGPHGEACTEVSISLNLPAKGTAILSPDDLPGDDTSFIPVQYQGLAVPIEYLPSVFSLFESTGPEKENASDSIRYYQIAYAFALESISRELFLPEVADTGPTGRWTGFFGPDDRERLAYLAQAMPGLCFAFTHQKCIPDSLLTRFVNDCINAVVRTALRKESVPLHGRAKSGKNPAAAWILSLWGEITPPSLFDSDHKAGKEMAEWVSEPLKGSGSRPFYTCLRLIEPSDVSSDFQVQYFIQAHDDPTLLIPAEEIWKKRSASITYLNRRFDSPSEQLLSDLFRAGKIFSPIQDSLRRKAPSGMVLSGDKVYSFLHDAVPLLRQQGIPVLLPSWWKDSSKRPALKLQISQKQKKKWKKGMGFFTPDALFSYSWEISIGDVAISGEEFSRLVDLKMPLVNIGGKWAAFNPDEIRKAITTFEKRYPGGEITGIDALRLGLSGEDENGLSVEVNGANRETKTILAQFLQEDHTRILSPVSPPQSFSGTLRPYQHKGLSWLSFITKTGFGACLADDMGLGKTVQLIAFLLLAKDEGLKGSNLLICPMSLIGNWQHEIRRFAPDLSLYVHHGPGRKTGPDFLDSAARCDIVLSTYQMVYRDQNLISSCTWHHIVLDEAQNIKNSETRQTKAVRSLNGVRRIALTGTPVENRLTELWSIMEFLNPGYLGPEKTFERTYSSPIEKYHDNEAAVRLSKLVRPFILRRVKTDKSIISDLPEKNVMKRYCTLTTEQATLYQAMVDSTLAEVDGAEGISRRAKILTALLRLKQICNHPGAFLDDGHVLPDRSGKISLLFSLLEEVLAGGEAAILFTQFSTFGEKLVGLMEKTFNEEVLFLHGGTPRKARDEMVQQFSHPHGPKIFVLSLKAGGVGLNLTRANHVFHIDRWWNPAVEDQATDRAHRIGQQKNVSVHLLISAGTIEERIDLLMEEKRKLAGSIIGTGEDWITSLSTDELRNLMTLQGEVIGGES